MLEKRFVVLVCWKHFVRGWWGHIVKMNKYHLKLCVKIGSETGEDMVAYYFHES